MKKPKAKIIGICVGLFFLFLILQFPFKNFRGQIFNKIYKETRILIAADDIGLALLGWPGISLHNVTVDAQRIGFSLSAESAVARIGIGQIWPFAPSISGSMSDLQTGGDLWFKVVQVEPVSEVAAELYKVGCELFSFYGAPPPVLGELNGNTQLRLNSKDLAKSSGQIDLAGEKLQITPQNFQNFFRLPRTRLNTGRIKININEGIAQIQEFQLGDEKADFQGTLMGEVRLGADMAQTFLNLKLVIRLAESFAKSEKSADLRGFLSGYKLADGSYGLRWASTIGEMQRNLFSAIPQKVN